MLFSPWLDSVRTRARLNTRSGFTRRRPKDNRQALIEFLETRQLLTAPNFVSVSPNVGEFLQDGDVRTDVPREFVFQFSPGQVIQSSTVGAIHVVGAGHDGDFTGAGAISDFGTSGGVVLRLAAKRLGAGDNGNTLTVFYANNAGNGPLLTRDAQGNLSLTLDTDTANAGANATTAQSLLDFAANNTLARDLLTVTKLSGNAALSLVPASPATFVRPLTGSGAAYSVQNFGVPGLNVLFESNIPGEAGNRVEIQINRLDLGTASSQPRITVVGQRIEVVLNENATAPTTATGLVNAINQNNTAALLVNAKIVTGSGTSSLSATPDGTLVKLSGADRPLSASAISGFQTAAPVSGNPLLVQFEAKQQGIDGNNISLVFNRANLGAGSPAPTISVSGSRITVTLNTNSSALTTAADLVAALIGNGAANALITPKVVSGLTTTNLTNITAGTIIQLGGADAAVNAGYRGLLPSNREVVYRFGSTLTDDNYRIEVIGSSTTPLTNIGGEAVDNGQDTFLDIELDLGAQVTSVVPQPILRDQQVTVGNVAKITDGDTLTVDPGTGTGVFVFEFNDTATQAAGAVRSGNFAIDINKTTATTASVAGAIAAAINTATLANPDVSANAVGSTVTVKGGAFDVRLKLNLRDTTTPLAISQPVAGGITQLLNQIQVYFTNDDLIDSTTVAENPAFYQLIDTKGTSSAADDTITLPTAVNYDTSLDIATLTFASGIPTGTFKLKVGSSQEIDGTINTAVTLGTLFAGSGYTTTAITGDNGTGATDLDLYQFDTKTAGNLSVTITPSSTHNTTVRLLDSTGTVVGTVVVNNGAGVADTLTAAALPAGTYFVEVSSSGASTTGSYRIDITTTAALTISDALNSSYTNATDLGLLGTAGKTLSSLIEPQSYAIPDMPGASDEPGHRDTPVEGSHGIGALGSATNPSPIAVQTYNFAPNYGTLFGSPLINQITEGQKARVRELLELWSRDFGIQFVETANSGYHIIVGDARAVDPTLPIGISVSAGSTIIMSAVALGTDESYGGGFMGVLMHEIGHSLGLGHAGELQAFMNGGGGGGSPNGETLYTEHDAVHLRNIYPLFSSDIDLYKFNVTETGTFTAGITAELRPNASLLDSALTLFRDPFATTSSDFGSGGTSTISFTSDLAGVFGNDIQLIINKSALSSAGVPNVAVSGHTITVTLDTVTPTTATQLKTALDGNTQAAFLINTTITGAGGTDVTGLPSGSTLVLSGGNREVIARNDDYNSNDSFINITLDPGTYYIGVSSTGNTSYDPTIADSGYGGNTDGAYDLNLSFTNAQTSSLSDTDNVGNLTLPTSAQTTVLDGDGDGIAGGDFNFAFQSGSTIFVDKSTATPVGSQNGDIATPFSTIAAALSKAAARIVAPVNGGAGIVDGDFFTINDGFNPTRVFEFNLSGGVNGSNVPIALSGNEVPSAVATAIASAINNQQSMGNTLITAIATGDHVDLTNLNTLDVKSANGLLNAVNLVRIVGNGGTDGSLATEADATPYRVGEDNFNATLPDGRTFDVPQGTTVMIDAGAVIKLQKTNVDVGTDPNVIGPSRQDGALQLLGTPRLAGVTTNAVYLTSFRNDAIGGNSDGASAGPVPGQWGGVIFRRDSDMNDNVFGDQDGANVFLNSIYQADLSYGGGAAPTVFSTIHIVDERPTIAFSRITNSADAAISANPNSFDDSLGRIGPDIHGNTLTSNSVNGLLVRIATSVGGPTDKLDVRGRFNDIDITHVISEQLQITGNAGGAVIVNEVQQLDVQGTPTAGFFTLTSTGGIGSASTSLNTPITAVQTTFSVANATVLPGGASFVAEFNIRVDGEEMLVTQKNGNVLTVVRGVNGTTAATHNTAATVARSRITTKLASTATAAQIQLALEYINGIGEGNVRVTGGSMTQAPVNIEYIGPLGSANQSGRLSVQNTPPGQVRIAGGNVVLTRITIGGVQTARPGGRLQVDPGVVVKLSDARIEGERGSSQLIAEGTAALPVIFTSLQDDRYGGAGGTFDTSSNGAVTATKGDWGGLFFGQGSRINVDHAYIAYGGGNVAIAGGNANFATIEAHEADLRLTNTTLEFNASGADGSARNFRTGNDGSVVFVKGAQPIIVNNTFHNNDGSVISIDANALKAINIKDTGRTTGPAEVFDQFANNQGPLVRMNRMANDTPGYNGVLGMEIRAAEITAESVWDDTDIVHVVEAGIFTIDNVHSVGGLRLQSAPDASLVVKLGTGAGFDIGNPDKNSNNLLDLADDGPLEITDRIGGTMQIIGAPGFPVVLTSLRDDTVGASLDTNGFPQTDTNGDGIDILNNATGARVSDGLDDKTGLTFTGTQPAAGNWGEILFNKYAHDRNVIVVNERERPLTGGIDTNSRLVSNLDNTAEDLGNLAPDNKSANENRRAGFEIHGHIAQDDPSDVDLYKFIADGATEVWLDIDFVDPALDTVVEIVSSNGILLARSQGNLDLTSTGGLTALQLQKSPNLGNDYYGTTIRDAGMRIITPGSQGVSNTYYIRVRSNPAAGNINDLNGGLTSGQYQLQVRLGQRDETPGVAVKFADIRYATNGIHVKGLPYHSPLLGESSETGTSDTANNTATPAGAINLGNLLYSDRSVFSAGGNITGTTDVDFYRFSIDIKKIQEIVGINGGPQTWATVIDLDWADGLTRPDTTLAVFRQDGQLVYLGRESNVADDQPAAGQGNDLDDLTRGSVGKLDPFIGSAMFEEDLTNGSEFYYLAVMNNQMQPKALSANFLSSSGNATTTRLEPVTSLRRIAEDHIGFQGYTSNGTPVPPRSYEDVNNNGQFDAGVDLDFDGDGALTIKPLLDIADATALSTHVSNFDLSDVVLFVSQDNQLRMINPLTGANVVVYGAGLSGGNNSTRDIAMSSDGILFGYQNVNNTNNTVGRLVRLDTGTSGVTLVGNDNISGEAATPQSQNPTNVGGGNGGNDFDDITTSDSVDAMTVERTGVSGNLPTYAGWYSVNENGVDVTGATSVNSKLYRSNLTTGAVANGGNDSGFGDIQYAGVVYASGSASVSNGSAAVTIFFQSKAPGLAGDGMILSLTNTGADNANITVGGGAGTVTVTIGRNATAQSIVDAINQTGSSRAKMTASIANGGNGGIAPGTTGSVNSGTAMGGVDDPTDGVLRGNVTGLSFDTAEPNNSSANLLYGVTSAGELISINRNTPNGGSSSMRMTATLITDFLNSTDADIVTARGAGFTGFTGLTLGPQNLHNGLLRSTLFATTNTGRLITFTIGGANDGVTLVNAFGSDNETQTLTSTATTGTFTLSYTYPLTGEVLTTAPLNFNATAGQVNTALQALVTASGLFPFLAADLNVTGTIGADIDIEFQGFYTDMNVGDLSVTNNLTDDAGLTGALTTTTVGGDGTREFPFVAIAVGGSTTGLAFSNLDMNLWHPTTRRGDSSTDTVTAADPGHGINLAFDNSRAPTDEDQVIQGRDTTEAQGGASFYFGLEAYQPTAAQTAYLNYTPGAATATQSQYGVFDDDYHRDITANVLSSALGLGTQISNNYNLPGGAYGTMTTNPIGLAGYNSADKPTLYFNYFLASQNGEAAQGQTSMRDSARVFASTDGGRTWAMIATNNTQLAAELPEFLAHSTDYNDSPIQELFDTANWRQARIDLSTFATAASVQFRFDFSTAGKINQTGLPGEEFGEFSDADGGSAAQKAQNNNFEGFYIDDIIVGFAERGELVTAAPLATTDFDNLYSGFAGGKADINNLEEPPTIVTSGTYQLEVRRGTEYAAKGDPKDPIGPTNVYQTFDTNERLIVDALAQQQPLTESFDLAEEFAPFNPDFQPAGGSSADWYEVAVASFPAGGSAPRSFRSGAITTGQQSGVQLQMDTGAGKVSFSVAVDAANFSSIIGIPDSRTFNGFKFLIDGVEQEIVIAGTAIPSVPGVFDGGAGEADGFILPGTGTATPAFASVSFDIAAGLHTFEWRYVKGVNSSVFGTDAAYIDNLIIPQPATVGRLGDQNVEREQGMVVLEGNFIRNVSGTGIIVEPGNRDTGGTNPTNLPYGGAPLQTPVPNTLLQVTHTALVNNVITNFGTAGIRFSGDDTTATDPSAAVPFGKLINNTIYGGGTATNGTAISGTGIIVSNNAAPTLMNNIIANTTTGISIFDTSGGNTYSLTNTDITTTLFQNNTNNGVTGNSAIINTGNASPLFVNPAVGNFYLATGITGNANEAIDGSLNTRFARTTYTAVTNPLGIPYDPNPFDAIVPGQDQFAPDIDRFGQLRVDDPSTTNALGIFRDLGGIERSDFVGGNATLAVPEDNGLLDLNQTIATIHVDAPSFFNQFVVKLNDAGSGIDDFTVDSTQFVLTLTTRTGTVTLVENTDYVFAYNANTNEAIFTSVTLYPQDARYTISIDNSVATGITDLAGNPLVNNQLDGTLRFDVLVTNGPNDPPVNTVPSGRTINESTSLTPTSVTFSAVGNNAISVDDPDAFIANTLNEVEVTLTGFNGAVTLPANYANFVTLTTGTGTLDPSVSFSGTIANINLMLAGGALPVDQLTFTPNQDYNSTVGVVKLQVSTSDLGNFSADIPPVPQVDVDDIIITVNAVNSAPTATSPATDSTNEDTNLTFAGTVSVSDTLDDPTNASTALVTVSVTNGVLSLNGTTGLTFVPTGMNNDGVNDASLTFSGTIANINAALNGLIYDPNQDFSGSATLTISVNDLANIDATVSVPSATDPLALTDSSTTTITVTAVNDDPVNLYTPITSTPATSTFPAAPLDALERTPFVFNSGNGGIISVSDIDAAETTGIVQVTLTATNGVLTLGSTSGLTITGGANGTTTVTFTGLIANINAALDGLTFDPDTLFTTPDPMAGPFGTVTILTNDLGASGGGNLTDSDTIELNVREVNDAPIVAGPNSENVDEDGTLTFSLANSNRITVSDADAGSAPVRITVSATNGVVAFSSTMSTTNLTLISGANGTASVELEGTLTDIQTALDAGVDFDPTADYFGSAAVTFSVNDQGSTGNGGPRVGTKVVAVTVAGLDDAPTISVPSALQVAVEDTNFVFSTGSSNRISVSDVDDPTGTGSAVYTISLTLTNTGFPLGTLTLASGSGVTTTGGANGTSTVTFTGTLLQINAALDGLVYRGASGQDTGFETLTIVADDPNVGSDPLLTDTATVSISLDGNNDAPINIVPTAQSTLEDFPLVFSTANGNLISTSDIDASNGVLLVTVSVTGGRVAVNPTAVSALNSLSGDNTSSLTMTGLLSELQAALDGLTFTPADNFVGNTTLTIITDDQGNTGATVVPKNDSDTVIITTTPSNDTPTVTPQLSPLVVAEDGLLTISGSNANGILIDDIDLGSGQLRVTLTVSQGTLTLIRTTGLNFIGGANGSATMTFVGTSKTAINAALDGMQYRPTGGFNGSASLTVVVNDQGNTGAGGPKEASVVIPVTVSAVNDTPTLTIPGATQSLAEDGNKVFSSVNGNSIVVADIDVNEGTGLVEVTLTVGSGKLVLGSTNNITFMAGSNNAATMRISGAISDINLALNGLVYTPNTDYNGTDSLAVLLSDLGNTGSGGIKTASGSIALSISAVNDAPINTVPTGPLSTDEEASIALGSLSVSDVDAGTSPLQVTLSAPNGRLTIGTLSSGATIVSGANNSSTLTLSGTVAGLQATLATTSFKPTDDFNGTAVITVTSTDQGATGSGGAKSDLDTFNIAVNPLNDQPIGFNDTYSVLRSGTLTTTDIAGTTTPAIAGDNGVLANDFDVDSPRSGWTATLINPPAHHAGTFTLNPDGTFTYTHDGTPLLTDSFTYHISDGTVANSADVTAIININDPPAITGAGTFQVNENSPNGTQIVDLNATDANSNAVTFSILSGNTSGAFVINETTGVITVANFAALNFETTPSFNLLVQAADNAATPGTSTANVIVNLNDVAEAVTISSSVWTSAGLTLRVGSGNRLRVVTTGTDTSVFEEHVLSNISNLTLNARNGSDDALTLDFANGTPIPTSGLLFNGGTGGADSLHLVNGIGFTTITNNFATALSGNVTLLKDSVTSVISYTESESIVDDLGAANRVFTYSSAADLVTLSDDGAAGNNISRITTNNTGAGVNFRVPSASLTISLVDGNDSVIGTAIDDAFIGTVTLLGGNGDDNIDLTGLHIGAFVDGLNGNDILTGGSGDDILVGSNDQDSLIGNGGNDNLIGGAGIDTLTGGAGTNVLNGNGASTDVVKESVSGIVTLTNTSLISASGTNKLANIELASLTGSSGDDSFNLSGWIIGSPTVFAGDGNDTILGSALRDIINGEGGNDSVNGGEGFDVVTGGAGNDTLFGDGGDDALFGDDGDDQLYGGSGNDTFTGAAGFDVILGNGGSGDLLIETIAGSADLISNATFTTGSIKIGSAAADIVRGVEKALLYGSTGADRIDTSGFFGVTTISAGAGNDTVSTGPGFDVVYGEAGNDKIKTGGSADIVYGGDGDDTIDGGDGNDYLNGNAGNDVITGNAGNDKVFGELGNDTLLGGIGNDSLAGGEGDDSILGEAGNDTIRGEAGSDRLAGGGNGTARVVGDIIVSDSLDLISDAFSFPFPVF